MFKLVADKVKINHFIKPLQSLASFIKDDDGGIVLNFDKEKLESNIYVKKESDGVLVFVKYKKELLENLEIDKDEKVGVLKLSDFIKYFSVIDDDKTEISFENNNLSIKTDNADITFKTADTDMISEGLKNFRAVTWLSEIVIDEKFDKLKKAMNVLGNEDCVYIKGDVSLNKLIFTVKSSSLDINKFTIKIDSQVTKDFELPFNKEYLQIALACPSQTTKLFIGERLICINADNTYSNLTYFIAKKAIK